MDNQFTYTDNETRTCQETPYLSIIDLRFYLSTVLISTWKFSTSDFIKNKKGLRGFCIWNQENWIYYFNPRHYYVLRQVTKINDFEILFVVSEINDSIISLAFCIEA